MTAMVQEHGLPFETCPPGYNDSGITKWDSSIRVTSPPQEAASMAEVILNVLEEYRFPHRETERRSLSTSSLLVAKVEDLVTKGEPISMVLPAFPFKSVNKASKVLGPLPDDGEKTALLHLEDLCKAVEAVYEHGARLIVVSDGLIYNDILGIPDEEVWAYGQSLRQIAKQAQCSHLEFSRFCDLLGEEMFTEPSSEEAYVKYAPQMRTEITRRYLPPSFNVDEAIADDRDINYTYCGYAKFLGLEFAETLKGQDMSKRGGKRYCKDIAKDIIVRGKAYAEAVAVAFPDYLRLSIHPSTDTKKVSIALIPQKGSDQMTPWHSALVRATDKSITMTHIEDVSTETHELVFKDDQPWCFEERSDSSS